MTQNICLSYSQLIQTRRCQIQHLNSHQSHLRSTANPPPACLDACLRPRTILLMQVKMKSWQLLAWSLVHKVDGDKDKQLNLPATCLQR